MAEDQVGLAAIVVDCQDPQLLASFWGELLGRPRAQSKGPYVWLSGGEGVELVFQKVGEPKVGKNRVHFDLRVADLAAIKSRVEALGGHRVEGYESGGFLVMADPEGNEFCLLPAWPFHLDEQGRAKYLDAMPSPTGNLL